MDSSAPKATSSIDITNLQKALESKSTSPISIRHPITTSYYDIQRLIYLQKQAPSSDVQVIFPYRLHPDIQSLYGEIQKIVSSGGHVSSIAIHSSTKNTDSAFNLILDHIDLLLYLSSQNASDVQAFKALSHNNTEPTVPNPSLIAGTLVSGGSYSLHISNSEQHITNIQVTLNTGKALTVSLTSEPSESSTGSDTSYGTLEDAARALRLYNCAVQSLKSSKIIVIKHIGENVVPIRTVGTAFFLGEGLFTPVSTNHKVAINGLHSGKADRVMEIFQKRIQEGEPFEFFGTHDEVLKNPLTSKSWRQIVYIPSLPGERKDSEMLDALKAGCIVLAEKPPFANADIAKEFLGKLDKDCERRLFFGWHYPHHFVIRKILQDIRGNKFGAIKHIRTLFTVAIPYRRGANIWDPSQGGAGINVHAYNLHCVLTLIGFNHGFEMVESKIENATRLDPDNKELEKVDLVMDTKLKFSNGVTADLYTSLDLKEILQSEAEILFENGDRMLIKQFCHPQLIIRDGFEPVLVQKAGQTVWENYLSPEDKKNPEYFKTTYEKQIDFVREQATGEGKYDADNDIYGVGMKTGIKLHEIVDAMFTEGGYPKKTGA